MKMANVSLKAKLFLFAAFTLILILAEGLNAFLGVANLKDDIDLITSLSIPKNKSVAQMDTTFRALRIELRTLGLGGVDRDKKEEVYKKISFFVDEFTKAQNSFSELGFLGEDRQTFENLLKEFNDFKKLGGVIISLSKDDSEASKQKLEKIFLVDCPAYAEKIQKDIEKLVHFYDGKTKDYSSAISKEVVRIDTTNIVVILVGVLLILILNILFIKWLGGTLNSIALNLKSTAMDVADVGGKIKESSDVLASESSAQASAIQEMSASATELKAMTDRNEDNTQRATSLIDMSDDLTQRGSKVIEELLVSINEIGNANGTLVEKNDINNKELESIIDTINSISDKTKIINDIVFQTKLLSFNASVEAARAGEHGKGFSVVAEEIGKLASMSGNSAGEISKLLEDSRMTISELVLKIRNELNTVIEMSNGKIVIGKNVVEQCSNIFREIIQNLKEISSSVQEIANAGKEQVAGVGELNSALVNLDQSAQTSTQISFSNNKLSIDLENNIKNLEIGIKLVENVLHGVRD